MFLQQTLIVLTIGFRRLNQLLFLILPWNRMIEGFLDDKRQNPSNKLDLAFFWSLVKEEGKDVCTMYQKLLIRLGIMEEEREEVYTEQVWQP